MSMKHYIDEILAMDPAKVEEMLSNGHDWASDHITSAKDDVAEVAEWIRTESEMIDGDGSEEEEEVEVKTEVEDSDDDSDEDEEEEESETEDEEEERESL